MKCTIDNCDKKFPKWRGALKHVYVTHKEFIKANHDVQGMDLTDDAQDIPTSSEADFPMKPANSFGRIEFDDQDSDGGGEMEYYDYDQADLKDDLRKNDDDEMPMTKLNESVDLKPCALCEETFVSESDLERHFNAQHGDENWSHVCKHCDESFKIENDLFEHIKEVHAEKIDKNAAEHESVSGYGSADEEDPAELSVIFQTSKRIKEEIISPVKLKITNVNSWNQIWNTLDIEFLEHLEFTDMEIECNDKRIKCHRWILAKQSPYFTKEFRKEYFVKSTILKVEEKNLKATIEVLRLFYEKKVSNNVEGFRGAYLYDVKEMIKMYESSISTLLTVDNVLHFYESENASEHLKYQLKKFTNDHLEEIISSEAWMEITRNKPKLLAKIIRSLA